MAAQSGGTCVLRLHYIIGPTGSIMNMMMMMLLHFYRLREISCSLTMESLARDRKCVDIRATATQHKEIYPHLLTAHALSGCDTVAQCWGVGKGKVVKVLKAGHTLPSIGTVSASEAEVVQEATSFMASCYGDNKSTTVTTVRRRVWKGKTGRANIVSAPKLQSMPPTDESSVPLSGVHLETRR